MDTSYSVLHSTFSEASVVQGSQPPVPMTPPDLQLYDHIFCIVLADLGKSEVLVWVLPKARAFFLGVGSEGPGQIGGWGPEY